MRLPIRKLVDGLNERLRARTGPGRFKFFARLAAGRIALLPKQVLVPRGTMGIHKRRSTLFRATRVQLSGRTSSASVEEKFR